MYLHCNFDIIVTYALKVLIIKILEFTKQLLFQTLPLTNDHLPFNTFHLPLTTYPLKSFITYHLSYDISPIPRERLDDLDILQGMQAKPKTNK